jgi:hypothetical protein
MDLPGLRIAERRAANTLIAAFETCRLKSTPMPIRSVVDPAARELNAGNPHARIVWTQALWDEFERHFDLDEDRPIPGEPVYWVMLADTACTTDLKGSGLDIERFRRHLCAGLRGCSYLGMFDPGLHVYIHAGTGAPEPSGISWHMHLFVWGCSPEDMHGRFETMRLAEYNYRSINPDGEAVGWSTVNEDNIHRRFVYMGKTPRHAYSVGLQREKLRNRPDEAEFASYRRSLRPGERVTCFDVLRKHQLPELTVAGGQGVLLRRRALRAVSRQ